MRYFGSIPALLAMALAACGSPAGGGQAKGEKLVIGGDDASARTQDLYQMPTPNELFRIVRQLSGDGQKRLMNPAANLDRYVTLPKRALNFGVYATDMVYASSYRLTSEVVRYYLACKKLGDGLGLAEAFSDSDFARLERNLAYGDSLDVIGNDAYQRVYHRMEDDDMGPTLALVLTGGWIESMHLVVRQVDQFDPSDPLVGRVAGQRAGLEHLMALLDTYKDNPDIAPIRVQMTAIQSIYDTFKVVRTPHKGASPSGRMVLGDDIQVVMTANGFRQLKTAVEDLRDSITRPEDPVEHPKNS